jgi:hypothetical protein
MLPSDHPSVSADFSERAAWLTHHTDAAPPKVEPISAADLKALEAKTIVIDVMMLYTKRVAYHYMLNPADVLELKRLVFALGEEVRMPLLLAIN